MEDERFREFILITTNFNLGEVIEWKETSLAREKYDEYRKLFSQFRHEFRRNFPEWHFPDGKFIGDKEQFDWGNGDPRSIREGAHSVQREAWELASKGNAGTAGYRLQSLSYFFARRAKKAQGSRKRVLLLMVETLEWLQRRVGSLKVCENPKCAAEYRYFFKVYNNDRYCCTRCIAFAKALRQAKRDAESQKPPKVYTFSNKRRRNMAVGAEKRWEQYRASKGKKKYERP